MAPSTTLRALSPTVSCANPEVVRFSNERKLGEWVSSRTPAALVRQGKQCGDATHVTVSFAESWRWFSLPNTGICDEFNKPRDFLFISSSFRGGEYGSKQRGAGMLAFLRPLHVVRRVKTLPWAQTAAWQRQPGCKEAAH